MFLIGNTKEPKTPCVHNMCPAIITSPIIATLPKSSYIILQLKSLSSLHIHGSEPAETLEYCILGSTTLPGHIDGSVAATFYSIPTL